MKVGITKSCLKKVTAKALLTFVELRTITYDTECMLNLRPLTCTDDATDVTVTPNHLICGRNTNKKCFDNNVTTDFDNKGVRNSFAHLKLVLQELSNRFENEYISPLKQRHIYNNKRYNNSTDDLINDVVLAKQKKTPRIKWKKAKIIDVIKGINNHIRGLQLKVFQPSLNQTFTISHQSTVKNITIQNYM